MHNPDNVSAVAQQLADFGYQRGAYTGWRDEGGTSLYVNLFQFADEKGAAGWSVGTQRGFANPPDFDSGAVFDTVEFAKWHAFKPANGYSFMAAVAWKGTFGLWIHLRIPGTEKHLPLLTQVLEDQYALLP